MAASRSFLTSRRWIVPPMSIQTLLRSAIGVLRLLDGVADFDDPLAPPLAFEGDDAPGLAGREGTVGVVTVHGVVSADLGEVGAVADPEDVGAIKISVIWASQPRALRHDKQPRLYRGCVRPVRKQAAR